MNETTEISNHAMTLAASRINELAERVRELEEALRVAYEELLWLNKGIGCRDGEWHAVALARSVLNKEKARG